MDVKVSVIIPVYNGSRYLKDNVESLLKQKLKEIEIIYVDDGSDDDTVEILQKYQQQDERIRIISQQNCGAGPARNNGFSQAQGKYVIFLDSDDFFKVNMLSDCYEAAEKHGTDIVMFGYCRYLNDRKTVRKAKYHKLPHRVFSRNDIRNTIFDSTDSLTWTKFYRRKFIENEQLEFSDQKKWNDVYFTRMSVVLAERMFYLKHRYVYYRVNNASSLQGHNNEEMFCSVQARIQLKNELKKRNLFDEGIVESFCRNAIISIEYPLNLITDREVLIQYLKKVRKHLIGDIFDDPQQFAESSTVRAIYEGENIQNVLAECLIASNQQKKNMISKDSRSYRIYSFIAEILKTVFNI